VPVKYFDLTDEEKAPDALEICLLVPDDAERDRTTIRLLSTCRICRT
jgi:hypothetical protein